MAMPRSMINTWLSLTDEKENHPEQPTSCPSPPLSSLRKPTKREAFASIDPNMSEPPAGRQRSKGNGRYDVPHRHPPHDTSMSLAEREALADAEAQAEAERTPRPTTRSRRVLPESAISGGGGEASQEEIPRRRTTRTSRRPSKHEEQQQGQEQTPEPEPEPPSSSSRSANRVWADALSSRVSLPLPPGSGAGAGRGDVFSSPSRSSASIRTTSIARSTGRARSPVKSMTDLRLSLKPPQILSFDLGPPDDVEELYQKLVQINDGERLVPAAAKIRFDRPKRPVKEWQIDNSPVTEAIIVLV
ncbi:Uu.00g136870.m01.CDS01 [Anthostomella pinea]|uniref:Uu.00g136870.m01.CDS01 n=1 Tax=Anthostomella pinea TaxID=933095 RepID=A0AAI8VPG1_9PEZI|nr:Uu.00g136870.m01.CDS01 [Anthostomella pinea]